MIWTGGSDATSWGLDTYNDGDDVLFGDTGAGNVAISGTTTPNDVTFDTTGTYVIVGDGIAGSGAVTKSGTGILFLYTANTYTGVTTLNGGSLFVNNGASLGSAAGNTVLNGGQLAIVSGATVADDIVINHNGAGSINGGTGGGTVTGAITLTPTGNVDFRGGGITLSGGVTSTNNAGLGLNGSNFIVDTNSVNLGTGQFTVTSSGNSEANASELNVAGNTWGNTTINFGGYLKLGVTDAMPTGTDVFFGWSTHGQSSGTLDLNGQDQTVGSLNIYSFFSDVGGDQKVTTTGGASTLTLNTDAGIFEYQGRFEGDLSLVKNGAGTQILNNKSSATDGGAVIGSSYTGSTQINAGVLEIRSGLDIGDTSIVNLANASGAIFHVGGTGNTETIGGLTGGGALGGWTQLDAGNELNIANAVAGSYDGILFGTGGIKKSGVGAQTFTAQNIYTGSTTIEAGTIIADAADNVGVSGALGNGGDITFTGGQLEYTANSASTDYSTRFANSTSAITLDTNGQDVTLAGIIDSTNTGGLTKNGTGVLSLGAANTYTGTTTLAQGVLEADAAEVAGVSGALGNGGDITFTGGTLRHTANSAGADYSSRVKNSTDAIRIDTNGQDVTHAQQMDVTNVGGLVKEGAGRLTINDNVAPAFDTYQGDTTVNGGELRYVSSLNDLFQWYSASNININNGSTFHAENAGGYLVFYNKSFNFDSNGGNTLQFTGASIFQTLDEVGTDLTTNGGATNYISGGAMSLQDVQKFNFNVASSTDDVALDVSTSITGGANAVVVKNGAGTMELSGNSASYIGDTEINDGLLLVSGTYSGATGTILVNSGGALGGTGTIGGDVTVLNGGAIDLVDAQISTALTISGALDLTDVAAGDLQFELGAAGADMITAGNLIIDGLELNDFTFTNLGGLSAGLYTLIDAAALTGSLGAITEGVIHDMNFQLILSGNDVIINVTAAVPEPSTSFLVLLGSTSMLLRRRRQ